MLLRYEIRSAEPVRIADNSKSQMGQTAALHYIPGSAIRGAVVEKLTRAGLFNEWKQTLLSDDTVFFNAYPTDAEGKDLLPAVKGFYEDKKEEMQKNIQNVVVNGDFMEGWKRASFGDAVELDEDTIKGFSVPTGSDLKIKIGDNVFRNEYMCAGITFTGYIQAEDSLAKAIKDAVGSEIILGNARSSGLGKCRVACMDKYDDLPYKAYADVTDSTGDCYLMLLSDTAMRDADGESCGLDLEQLGELLGVYDLQIMAAATSVRTVCGYNRTWGVHIPFVNMYEKGSVFHLTFDGTCTSEKKKNLMMKGVGIRKNEGFGRVLFLKDYEKLKHRLKTVQLKSGLKELADRKDEATLLIAAKSYYHLILERAMEEYIAHSKLRKGGISASRLGVIRGKLEANRFSPKSAKDAINEYYEHDKEKENSQRKHQEKGGSSTDIVTFINGVFENRLDATLSATADERTASVLKDRKIMGIDKEKLFSADEAEILKIDFMLKLLKYDNKQEARV